jgi:tetratricopeptide (TPR) repeat protein
MRILTILSASLLGADLMVARPPAAFAEDDRNWKTCVSTTTVPNEKVTACGAVIDAKTETGKRLAVAYCFRGHGLTEKRELDAALSDLDESIRLDPHSACALTNRGRVYGF